MSMSKKIVPNKIIYPNRMNREDLSKLSKDQLINMLLRKQTASANKAGSVKQTASAKAGPVFQPKSVTQLAANKIEQSIKRPAALPKQSTRLPTLKTLAANAMVKNKIKYLRNCPINKLLLLGYTKFLFHCKICGMRNWSKQMCLNIYDIHHSKICFTIDYNECLVKKHYY